MTLFVEMYAVVYFEFDTDKIPLLHLKYIKI